MLYNVIDSSKYDCYPALAMCKHPVKYRHIDSSKPFCFPPLIKEEFNLLIVCNNI